jgi:hypothetical protein
MAPDQLIQARLCHIHQVFIKQEEVGYFSDGTCGSKDGKFSFDEPYYLTRIPESVTTT